MGRILVYNIESKPYMHVLIVGHAAFNIIKMIIWHSKFAGGLGKANYFASSSFPFVSIVRIMLRT